MNKIVTICGSMRFTEQMKAIATRLELEKNYIVIQCVYFESGQLPAPHELEALDRLHLQKIELCDAIFVVNVGGYIGESTKREIEYAKARGKEIMFLESDDK